jgi:mitochondrial intermembrane space import and assembly protein 40
MQIVPELRALMSSTTDPFTAVQTRPHLPAVDDDEAQHKLEDILTEKRLLETENARTQQPQSQTTSPSSAPAEAQGTSGSARTALAPSETSSTEPSQDGGPDPIATAASANALEEEAGNQGAFDPETGEINWDCPCLGGMAHGPCGEQFKAAFSCFVYSKEEPKGMDCIDKFQ